MKTPDTTERHDIVPDEKKHTYEVRSILGRLTGKPCAVQVLCDDCGVSAIRTTVSEALERMWKVPCSS